MNEWVKWLNEERNETKGKNKNRRKKWKWEERRGELTRCYGLGLSSLRSRVPGTYIKIKRKRKEKWPPGVPKSNSQVCVRNDTPITRAENVSMGGNRWTRLYDNMADGIQVRKTKTEEKQHDWLWLQVSHKSKKELVMKMSARHPSLDIWVSYRCLFYCRSTYSCVDWIRLRMLIFHLCDWQDPRIMNKQ